MNTFTGAGRVGRLLGLAGRGMSRRHFIFYFIAKVRHRATCPLGIATLAQPSGVLFVDLNALFLGKWKILCHIFYLTFFTFFLLLLAFFFFAGQVGVCVASGQNWLWMKAASRKSRRFASRRNVAQLTLFLIPSCPLSGAANEACKSPNQDESGNGNGAVAGRPRLPAELESLISCARCERLT